MTADDLNSWRDIQAEVMRRINNRVWKPGDTLPHETELAAEFGCARATVNRAMQAVASAGYIERRRRAGSRVTVNPVRKARLEIPIIRQEVENRGKRWGYRLLGRRLVRGDRDLLHVTAVHTADATPFVLEKRWINATLIPPVVNADLAVVSANEWLVQNAPFSHGEIEFSADGARPREARILGVVPGAALFVVQRRTWIREEPITAARLSYAPGFSLMTRI